MSDARHLLYFNGEFVPAAAACLPLDDCGVGFGLGFFETFRTSGGHPHHWPCHRARLARACATAGIDVPSHFLAADEARLADAVRRLLREAALPDAVFRYTITAGAGGAPAEFLASRPLPPAAPAGGIALRVLNLARDNGEFLPRPKSLNYANAFLGAQELARRSRAPADEGLFLSRDGRFVVETPRQSIAWFEGTMLCYPEASLGGVAGTCRQWLLESARPVEAQRALLDDLLGADAIFVCNAVRGITPVCEIWSADDRTLLGTFDSAAHPAVLAFRARWEDALRATAAAK